MKKLLSLLLTLVLLAASLLACAQNAPEKPTADPGTGKTAVTSEQTDTQTPAQTSDETNASSVETPTPSTATPVPSTETPVPSTETPEPTPEPLPAAYTLLGSKHVPKPDDQGSIGSCSSEAVTYMQFTVAVSQYMNYYHPELNWDPSSGDASTQFSPKFTYNFGGAGTEYAYKVLMDDGCLPMSVCITDKNTNDGKYWGGSRVMSPQSRAWEVGEGMMIEALKFRLTGYEEDEFLQSNACQLTTNDYGRAIIEKTKDALVRGNAVVLSGWSSYWEYTTIKKKSDAGTIGKAGQHVIWSGFALKDRKDGSDGNHCITIIGYDDDISVTVNGVTMKGAFLLRNSWGNWMDEGNCFIMYDAFNKVSEFGLFNVPEYYNGSQAVSVDALKTVNPMQLGNFALYTTFTPAGETVYGEETYPTYYLFSDGKCLSYKGGTFSKAAKGDENCLFALIPAEKVFDSLPEEYAGRYLLYAVSAEQFLTLKSSSVGSEFTLTAEPIDPAVSCFIIDQKFDAAEDGSFSYMIAIGKTGFSEYERTGTIYRFSWTYWDKDIKVEAPELIVEAEVEMKDRITLDIWLTRTDKNGAQERYEPACMSMRIQNGSVPGLELKEDETLSFHGNSNVTEPETGYFAFAYDPLLSENYTVSDFLWGVDVSGTEALVKSVRLYDKDGNLISLVKTGETEPLQPKETASYVFNFGSDLQAYIGEGAYRLRNVGTGKLLTLAKKTQFMTFAFESGQKDDAKHGVFNFRYDAEKEGYYIWNAEETFVYDNSSKKLTDGAPMQLNKLNFTSITQLWTITQNENGQITIAAKNDPTLVFGYDGSKFVLHKAAGENDLWCFEAAEEYLPSTSVESQGEAGLTVTVRAPKKYTEGAITLAVLSEGKEISRTDVTLEDGTAVLHLDAFEKGTYIFCTLLDGKPYGVRTIFVSE